MSVAGTYDVVTKSPMGDQQGKFTVVPDGDSFTGQVTGPMAGPVDCKLKFTSGSNNKLTYTGACKFGKGQTDFRGTLIYNEGSKRYETAGSGQGVAVSGVGKVSGGNITFSVSNLETSYGIASSTMVFAGSSIKLSFKLVDKKGTTASSISFRKS